MGPSRSSPRNTAMKCASSRSANEVRNTARSYAAARTSDHTGQIGLFRIVSEESVGAGVRRIEAITGRSALEFVQRNLNVLDRIAETLHAPAGEAETVIESLRGELHAAQKENARLRAQMALGQASGLAQRAVQINGIAVVAAELPDADSDTLREVSDQLRGELGASIVVLATVVGGETSIARRGHRRRRQAGRTCRRTGESHRKDGGRRRRRQADARSGRRARCRQTAPGAEPSPRPGSATIGRSEARLNDDRNGSIILRRYATQLTRPDSYIGGRTGSRRSPFAVCDAAPLSSQRD